MVSEGLFSPQDLREWFQDDRGEQFWNKLEEMKEDGLIKLRAASRAVPFNGEDCIRMGAYLEVIEDVFDLVETIIDEEEKEKEKQV